MNTDSHSISRNHILVGDAATTLRTLEAGSVDMVLTSPPYFRLRDYDSDGQTGLEGHVEQWVDAVHEVVTECHRLLVPTGTLWLNLGDTYSRKTTEGADPKSLLMGPERLALRLVAEGWILRNKIVWQKKNFMPTSVQDRLACSWEAVYVFAKQRDYFFDLDAIRVPHLSKPPKSPSNTPPPRTKREQWRGPNTDDATGLLKLKAAGRVGHPLGKNPGDVWTTASSNYRGSHHATFPVALADLAFRAGCPEARCNACRAPWRRLTPSIGGVVKRGDLAPTCSCDAAGESGLVLDPYFGAGSTAIAAVDNRRDWAGIELNPGFAAEATARIAEHLRRMSTDPVHAPPRAA